MSSTKPLDFAIIGGGIGGLCMGLALHHRGVPVRIYEAAHNFGEIGAGVSFTPFAVQAMEICHPEITKGFNNVCTRNAWESKQNHRFEIYDGRPSANTSESVPIVDSLGQNAVHRAEFLDEMIKIFPKELASFGKRLVDYKQNDDGVFTLDFADGTTATAHAIIGCDGIKSHVRMSMFGEDHPCAQPSCTHKYAYRALAPMKDAIAAVGEEKALNASFYVSC
jgi:salicylate hydroxylase